MKISKLLQQSGGAIDRVLAFLDAQSDDEIFTTTEVEAAVASPAIHSGGFKSKPWLWKDYTYKMVVDGQLQSVWGNRKSIAQLRRELNIPEESNENQ